MTLTNVSLEDPTDVFKASPKPTLPISPHPNVQVQLVVKKSPQQKWCQVNHNNFLGGKKGMLLGP